MANAQPLAWLAHASAEQRWYWFLGVLDSKITCMAGRPSQPKTPRIELLLQDRAVAEAVAGILGTNIGRGNEHSFLLTLGGRRAVAAMAKLRGWLSPKRQAQIDRVLAHYAANGGRSLARVTADICAAPECVRAPVTSTWCEEHSRYMAVEHG